MTSPAPPRRALLIVRAGDRSLHPHWLRTGRPRTWDLHVSYYGDHDAPFGEAPADVTLTREKGAKFPGLVECLGKLGDRLDRYDYIGLPDDDLYADGETWTRLFEVIAQYDLALAQPALDRRSFYTYNRLLQRPGMLLRWTNFVELMAPVFRRDALERVGRLFAENSSGWGLDDLWPVHFDPPARTMAVIDAAPVLHTRAVGVGPLYALLKAQGKATPGEEKAALLVKHQVAPQPFQVYGGVTTTGRVVGASRDLERKIILPRLRLALRRRLSRVELPVP